MPGTLLATDMELNPSESTPVPTTHFSHPTRCPLQNFQCSGCQLEYIQAGKTPKSLGTGSINPLEQGSSNKSSPEEAEPLAGSRSIRRIIPEGLEGERLPGTSPRALFTGMEELEAAQEGRAAAAGGG